jgi:hypothetical protein
MIVGVKIKEALARLWGFTCQAIVFGLLTVLCSERERPFFIPSPAMQFPERAEGVKGLARPAPASFAGYAFSHTLGLGVLSAPQYGTEFTTYGTDRRRGRRNPGVCRQTMEMV